MPIEITQEQLMRILYQQAVLLFGRERAKRLKSQLQERAGYLYLLLHHSPLPEEEPDFAFLVDSSI